MRQCTRRVTRRLPVKCSIRPMMEADLREVLRIEYEAFPFAWKEGGFLLILRHGKFLAVVANALTAAIFISSLIADELVSSAPRKINGNPSTLFT